VAGGHTEVMTTLIDQSFNQASWGDSLRAYKSSKCNLGFTQELPHHETTYAHSRDERDNKVDPVLQKFRDPSKEANLKKWEDAHHIRGLNKSFDLQLTRESQFDVVSNVHKKEGLSGVPSADTHPPQRPNLSLQSGVHYNILSNHNHDDHALPERDRDRLERVYTPQQVRQPASRGHGATAQRRLPPVFVCARRRPAASPTRPVRPCCRSCCWRMLAGREHPTDPRTAAAAAGPQALRYCAQVE
jgi:hypothetical protein